MDLARITPGERLAAAGGVMLVVAMFVFRWFEADAGGELNGWDSFGFPLDLLVFLGGVFGVGHAVMRAAGVIPGEPPAPRGRAVVAVGALVAALVLVRLIATPGDTDAQLGGFLALLAALCICAGGAIATRDHLSGRAAEPGRAQA